MLRSCAVKGSFLIDKDAFPKKAVSVTCAVENRPLHLLNPRNGEREYLRWVPPGEPIRYLGVQITSDLNWDPHYKFSLGKLDPLLRQVKLGRKLGLAWDVFLLAATSKVMGLISYHTTVAPFGAASLTVPRHDHS